MARKPQREAVRRGKDRRPRGDLSVEPCTCKVKLKAGNAIECTQTQPNTGFFRPTFETAPACEPAGCNKKVAYAWTLVPDPAAVAPVPVIDGSATNESVKVLNKGRFTLTVNVKVECSTAENGALKITKGEDTGSMIFAITH